MYHDTTTIENGFARVPASGWGQESLVLDHFRLMFPAQLTPEQVQEAVLPNTPITSVRRAITDLAKAGHLIKCGQVKGRYGRPVHQWSFAGTFTQQDCFRGQHGSERSKKDEPPKDQPKDAKPEAKANGQTCQASADGR